ncbi:MAG: hypothetical protein Q8O00_09125 [Holophaga sp.]|nr:hypothetical protein [Holophaga sp.]
MAKSWRDDLSSASDVESIRILSNWRSIGVKCRLLSILMQKGSYPMASDTKKLGEMLVEAGLINPAQLQEALRHQRIAGGRMGSNLVSMGFVSEEVLMDFLAHQTGVPRLDTKALDVPIDVLRRIPRRLAEQLHILPIAFKEPRSLVLAMTDPSDLNSIDSARFASGLNIEPVVVSHSSLKLALVEQYRKLDALAGRPESVTGAPGTALPVALDLPNQMDAIVVHHSEPGKYSRDPFFDDLPTTAELPPLPVPSDPPNPFNFFTSDPVKTAESPIPPARIAAADTPLVIHSRTGAGLQARKLDSFQTRTLVLGIIKMLQRRGVLGEDELQRFITNLLEAGEIKDEER